MGLEIRLDRAEVIGVGRCATTDELAALDERGFVIVPALLADEDVDLLRTEFERLVAEDAQSRRHELGTRRAKATSDNDVFAVCAGATEWCWTLLPTSSVRPSRSVTSTCAIRARATENSVSIRTTAQRPWRVSLPRGSSTPSLPTTAQPGSCRAHTAPARPGVPRYRSPAPRF